MTVNVSVKQGGQPVANLTAADFAITDNGVPQTVDQWALTRLPIDLTLVMAWHKPPNQDIRDAYFRGMTTASSIRGLLQPEDRLRAVWASADLKGGLLTTNESLWLKEVDVSRSFLSVSVMDGLYYAIAWPVEPGRRHLAVAFTAGLDRHSVLDKTMLVRLAAHSDAVLHVVFTGDASDYGAGVPHRQVETDREIVSQAARRTGGTVRTSTIAAQDLAAIVEDYRTSYVLQYTPREPPAPGWHELRVRVTRPGRFDVRARQGYEVKRN